LARKILLADDSVTAQNMGRKILADAGYEVIAVNNGSAALKKIAELKPDLVILDVYMPGYSGLEVCQRLKESPETSRIPVLLTVGKLEPFKPEEAQRVRAEGFIVKPFEASELLGTLSKLEDKVVPRAEPSKPGRFARAIAAAEESGRGGRNQAAGDDNGWKNRIGFPKDKDDKDKEKTEPEQKVADEAAISNPVNRAVETSAEKASEKKEESREPAGAAEANLDVAALAPAGLPKDVTPEEVAAIAAAAAQMQMVVSALKGEHQVSAAPTTETQIAQTTNQTSLEPAPDKAKGDLPSPPEVPANLAPAAETEAKTDALAESKSKGGKLDSAAGEPAEAEIYHRRKGDASSEETRDMPVTMAATAESVVATGPVGSRWTAVSVALEGSEAAISLDQEMQKAYSAFAAAVSASGVAIPLAEPASAANSSGQLQAAAEPPAAISNPEPASPRELASRSSQQPEAAAPAPITAETAPAPVAAPAETSPTVAFSEPNREPAPVAASGAQEWQSRQESETAMAEAATAAEPKLDSEAVKNTAAAWASWRQTRDTGKGNESAEAQPREFGATESAPAEKETARAVAAGAGAEQILQEAAAAASKPNGDQNNVASIVDSVLADLRPKLMEEISRKMSEKK
jgi:CheY-like chemotaxis protein